MQMTSCDDYQVAALQRLHGALEAGRAGTLAAHLSSCATCRAFETGAKELEEAMKVHAERMSGEVDWERLGASLARWRKRLLAGQWQALAGMLVVVPLVALAFGDVINPGAIIGALTVLALGWFATRRRLSESQQAARSSDELLVFLRAQHDQLIRTEKQNAVALPIIALLPLLGPLLGGITPWSVFGTAMTMALLAALAVRSRFVLLPRLERERAELG